MGQTTDELVTLAGEVSPNAHPREMDMLLTAGERISMALCAMAIADLGVPAMSLTGSQAGIITTATHGHAEILEIRADRVRDGVDQGQVVIVAGFQGFSRDSRDITTLGRGGSDATAVALAASLGADACEIYTDVDGVFTADPRVVPDARKLDEVSFEEMLELAATGAGVLMTRSVEFGRRYRIPIHVRSSFHDGVGTWVKEETMEAAIVRGVSHDTSEAKVTVAGVPDKPGIAADLFEPLATAGVNVDMIVQNVSRAGVTDISFTVPKEQAPVAGDIAKALADRGRGRRRRHRPRHRPGVVGGGRDQVRVRDRRADVPHPRRPRDQHRDDLDVAGADLVRGELRRRGGGGAPPPRRLHRPARGRRGDRS